MKTGYEMRESKEGREITRFATARRAYPSDQAEEVEEVVEIVAVQSLSMREPLDNSS